MDLVEMGGLKVVGIQVRAGWERLWVEVPAAWKEFVARHEEIGHRVDDRFMDICLGKEDGVYTQLVCVEVSEFDEVPPGMTAREIPAQCYIRHRHVGPPEGIAASFGAIYDWARENGHAADEFKVDYGYTADGEEDEHELLVRVAI